MAKLEPLDVVSLATDLMRIDSTSGHETEATNFVHGLLEGRGWRLRRIPVSAGRDNLVAAATDDIRVTLSTHLDTVPPYIPPRLDRERLWGRGACDAKGIAAAMICAAESLRERAVPVALLFVVGEEVSHDGARAANLAPTTSRVLINGEPTESMLALGTKGAVRLTLRTDGMAAHSAYPHLGRSAIDELVRLLHELQQLELPSDPVLGETTVNVGMISGGVADNVLAPSAEARLMIRLVTSLEKLLPMIQRWLDGRATLTPGVYVPPVKLATVDGFPTSVVAFATDIPELRGWGKPYLFGPGSVRVAHRDDEHIALSELREAVGSYVRLALAALSLE